MEGVRLERRAPVGESWLLFELSADFIGQRLQPDGIGEQGLEQRQCFSKMPRYCGYTNPIGERCPVRRPTAQDLERFVTQALGDDHKAHRLTDR